MKNRNSQSVIPSGCNQPTLFINRPFAEGKVFPCGEEHFWKSIECKRVKRLDLMRKGELPHNDEEFEGLKRNQPMFNFTNRYTPDGPKWNGRFLFSYHDAKFAEKVIMAHAEELGVILAFREPDYDRYWFLVDVQPVDFSEETAKQERIRILGELHRYFPRVTPYGQWFFCRAVPEEYIDYLDGDALFDGVPTGFNYVSNSSNSETSETSEASETSEILGTRSFRTMSLGEILDQMFGGIFKNRPANCLR